MIDQFQPEGMYVDINPGGTGFVNAHTLTLRIKSSAQVDYFDVF